MINREHIYQNLMTLKQQSPLVHNITNLVVMNTSANILLALGAPPIMAHAEQELVEIITISNSLVLNIGTLDEMWLAQMLSAQIKANKLGKPIVLDPVGAGASKYRTAAAKQILQQGVTIVRGNASEIMALQDDLIQTRGVDSQHATETAVEAAKLLSEQYGCTVVISGKIDYIVDKKSGIAIDNGDEILTKVTGMGCSSTAVIAAFAAVINNPQAAAVSAVSLFNVAAEIAAEKATGPGTFYPLFLDALSQLDENVVSRINITAI